MKQLFQNLSPGLRIALIIEAIVAVAILVVAVFLLTAKRSSEPVPQFSEYISLPLQISLKYPYGWQLDTSFATIPGLDRYTGENGYFEVSATNSSKAKVGTFVKKYPKPIKLGATTYRYFLLTADPAHLKSIGDTVVFINP